MVSLLVIIVIPLAAVFYHQVLFTGVEAPPSDHGSGSMFDLIATRYDLINRVLAIGMDVGWRKRMVNVIKGSVREIPNPQILDLATGTADVALLLAKSIPSASILGVDPSSNMLDVGRKKIREQKLEDSVRLQIEDARVLENLEDDSFDAATMAFGIRNVPDRGLALCQIRRVLKDGARFCILEFSEPDDTFGIMGAGARLFIRHVVPFMGGLLSGAPREYWHLQNSIKDFPAPPEFAKQIESQRCEGSNASFHIEELIQLNFGSVQLYVSRLSKPALN